MRAKSLEILKDPLKEATALFRVLAHLREKSPQGRTGRSEIANVLGYSERQTQRYLNILNNSDLIQYDKPRRSYILTERGSQFPQVTLETEEALALVLAATVASGQASPSASVLSAALRKVTAGLPAPLQRLARETTGYLLQKSRHPMLPDSLVTGLLTACHEQQVVRIDYTSESSGRSWRVLHPYSLDIDGPRWYVHGWCVQNQTIRTFKLATLYAIELLEEPFERDEVAWSEFKQQSGVFRQWRGGESVEVEVLFSPEVAAYARRTPWPEGLALREQGEGSVLMTGEARGIEGIVPELLRWRRHVRVLGGTALRAAYVGELRAMLTLYEKNLEEESVSALRDGTLPPVQPP
jgi:predicted DNA-binding transcriptional regulator YafY